MCIRLADKSHTEGNEIEACASFLNSLITQLCEINLISLGIFVKLTMNYGNFASDK